MCVISLNGYSDTYKGLWNNGWEDWARWSNALTVRLCCSLNGLWINFSWENNYCWLHLFMRILKNSPVNLPPHTPLLPNPHLNCSFLPRLPFFPRMIIGSVWIATSFRKTLSLFALWMLRAVLQQKWQISWDNMWRSVTVWHRMMSVSSYFFH